MRAKRTLAVGLVFLILSMGWLSVGLLGSSVVTRTPGYYLSVNQEVVPPGGSFSAYVGYPTTGVPRVQLLRVDPVLFAHNQTQAIQDGVRVAEQSVLPPATSPNFASSHTTFNNVSAGLYVVVLVSEDNVVAWDPVQVTKIGLVERRGATKDLVWAVRLADGSPVSNVSLHDGGKEVGRTGADGLAWLPKSTDRKLVGVHAEGVGLLGGNYWYGDRSPHRVAIYSDRPLYRPGQTVHLKLIAWKDIGERFAPQANTSLELRVLNYHNGREATIEQATLRTNGYGSVARDVALPEDAALGYYTVQARWQGETFYGSFEVQEYRLPKFRVDVTPNDKRIAVGDPLELLVNARYYYGEPLTDGTVHYEINGNGWGWMPCAWCSYEYVGDGQAYHSSGNAAIRADGSARLAWTPEQPGTYSVHVQVTAITGERIDASAQITVAPADRLLGMTLSQWVVEPNRTNTLRLRLTDLAERAVDDDVHVSLVRAGWVQRDGNWVEDRAVVRSWDARTSGGNASLPFDVAQSGSYRFEARTIDDRGRTTTTSVWFWASDGNWNWWRGQQLEIIPERTAYNVGDAIRLNVAANNARHTLVTLEGQDVYDAVVLRPDQRTAAFTAAARHTPDVFATATQVDAADAYSTHYYPALPSDSVRLTVGPHRAALKVIVETDRQAYSDGEAARILVRVLGPDGRPVRAEVSIALVDEALLSLRPDSFPGLLATFYPGRNRLYPTASWFHQSWSSDSFAVGGAGGTTGTIGTTVTRAALDVQSDREGPPGDINVREYFPETAVWLPQLQTDDQGVLRLHAILPDSLTTWHISVHAISKEGHAGDSETNILTRRNVVADVFAPRFLIDGDEATIQATVANYVGVLTDFRTLLNASGVQVVGADARTLSLSHGQSDIVSYKVRATQPGTATLTFYAWNGADKGDAIRIRIPVLPHGIESRETKAGRGPGTVTIVIPPSASASPSRLNVTLSPTIADVLVEALPYLTGFPYGCVEQTLSRFLPTLAVAQAAQELGLDKSKIDPKIDEQVEFGIQRLYGFQHEDGGWGWWSADGRNPYTTTYVVYGLARARDLGYDVDAKTLSRGVEALRSMTGSKEAPALDAYARYALTVADKSSKQPVPAGTSAAELALGALVAHHNGDATLARQKTAQLVALATTEAGRTYWRESQEAWGPHGITSDTMLTALALRALIETGTQEAAMHGSARWLLENRVGNHWYTTKDTAEAILSLSAYFRHESASKEPFKVELTIDGEKTSFTMDPSQVLNASHSMEKTVAPGTHTVSIASENPALYWSVAGLYWDGQEPIRSKESEFRVTRTMRNDRGEEVSSLRVGEEAIVRVEATAIGQARRYVQIESPLPAGLEVLTPQYSYNRAWWHDDVFMAGRATGGGFCNWCHSWSAAEVRDDRVGFFAARMEAGETYVFEYRVRAVFPGDYHVMPAGAEEMYDPDVRGHGAEQRVRVDAAPGVQFGRFEHVGDRVRAHLYPVGSIGNTITAVVRQGDQETSRLLFDRQGAERWTIELPAPVVGDYHILVEGGASVAKKFVKRTPELPSFPERFNETTESVWEAGAVLEVRSALAVARAPPQYGAFFEGREPEPFDSVSKRRGIEGFTFAIVAMAGLVAMLAAFRRKH